LHDELNRAPGDTVRELGDVGVEQQFGVLHRRAHLHPAAAASWNCEEKEEGDEGRTMIKSP
jgi:hypothetical protein